MYVAVKGGEAAIDNAHALLAEKRRGDTSIAELSVKQIQEQLSLAVDRVMTEGSLYDPELAALAIKQAMGDTVEAIFLLRAYRTTLPRFSYTQAIDTNIMRIERRISATYKDIPGGQSLGPTFDYTHRLLDFSLLDENNESEGEKKATHNAEKNISESANTAENNQWDSQECPRVSEFLRKDGLLQADCCVDQTPADLTRQPLIYPSERSARLQNLARADEGFLLALGYSTQRGYARNHPFAGEIRMGYVEINVFVEELGFDIPLGEICITECDMINQFAGNQEQPPQFTRGYGIGFGFCERKTLAMALVDRSLQAKELGEATDVPATQEEFVLSHCDNVESSGFVSHLKLPHYVDFQSELALVRQMRADHQSAQEMMGEENHG